MRKRVLIAEDNDDMRRLLALVLTDHGYEVTMAKDGLEALTEAQRQPPDLVVTDHAMPRMTGVELVESLRSHPHLRSIPVVLLTAGPRRLPEQKQRLFSAVVEKFVDLDALVRTVRSLCPPGPERRQGVGPVFLERRKLA